ncbi:hypothetical protein AVEN_251041-1 [Araneus ventricosus]|uniref:Uncharacterized protein n=1 Tax=Araneus ventricosus TaxID=182803 RepID=A0A4Y2DM89_ARAVE|nr:hypothetical protein AVEN_251041-1 [Araneus ventricosus]
MRSAADVGSVAKKPYKLQSNVDEGFSVLKVPKYNLDLGNQHLSIMSDVIDIEFVAFESATSAETSGVILPTVKQHFQLYATCVEIYPSREAHFKGPAHTGQST